MVCRRVVGQAERAAGVFWRRLWVVGLGTRGTEPVTSAGRDAGEARGRWAGVEEKGGGVYIGVAGESAPQLKRRTPTNWRYPCLPNIGTEIALRIGGLALPPASLQCSLPIGREIRNSPRLTQPHRRPIRLARYVCFFSDAYKPTARARQPSPSSPPPTLSISCCPWTGGAGDLTGTHGVSAP